MSDLVSSGLVQDAATALPQMDSLTRPVFLVVSSVTGRIDPAFPTRSPFMQIDAFAKAGLEAEVLAATEMIRDHCYDGAGLGIFPVKAGYFDASLSDVTLFGEPRRSRIDAAKLARAVIDVELTYVVWESVTV
ncbi:hypothetical protein [Actinoplanes sp. NPDC005259]|uniref:hypothetical protein n=1 Tax=Actinoplanes sp. NPDC005259 TaxID=3154674 RepID=UPI0033AB03CD